MKLNWIRFALEELKFIRSFDDVKIFSQKLSYSIPRMVGTVDKYTKQPPSLQIEPTNICNLICTCCSISRSSRERGFMEFDLFEKIVDDASEIGVKRIHLYLHGEPMLHPRIVDMIGHMKSKGLGFSLTTNGMLLNQENSEAILRSGVNSADHIIFSILGYSKGVHEAIMKGVDHDKVIRNLLNFLELRKKLNVNGPIVETIFYTMPENKSESEQFFKQWQGMVDHVRMIEDISRQFADFKTENESHILIRRTTCRNLWERMTIFWNGDVTTCIADLDGTIHLGNLKEKSIREIWNCDDLLSIKKLHKEKKFKDLHLCSRCDW